MKKQFKNTFKCFLINALIFSLIQNPIIQMANGAEYKPVDNFKYSTADAIIGLTQAGMGIASNYLGMQQQSINQLAASQKNQDLIKNMDPSCRKPDKTACYAGPAKFFPDCQIPPAISPMPYDVCSTSTDVNKVSTSMTYNTIAKNWVNFYNHMSSPALNSSYPVGLSCLEGKKKAFNSKLTDMINSITRLQTQLEKESQFFRDTNKKFLADMVNNQEELMGASKNNLDRTTKDFSKMFSPTCQTVIGKEGIKSGNKNGLNSILQDMVSTNKDADDFISDKAIIENNIRRETDQIKKAIAANGPDAFLTSGYQPLNIDGNSNFSAINFYIQTQSKEYSSAKETLKKKIADLPFPAPPLDNNFNSNLEKKYIRDCFSSPEKGIATMSVDDILKSIHQRSTNDSPMALDNYKNSLKNILNSTDPNLDKMEAIRKLNKTYTDITITYKTTLQSQIVVTNPAAYFEELKNRCRALYNQDDEFKAKADIARNALQETKNLENGFSSKVTQSILSQVLNCNGTAPTAKSCSKDALDPATNKSFCIAHASSCANNIKGCYAEVKQQVEFRKKAIKDLARLVNENTTKMIASANALYDQQKAGVANMVAMIQQTIPGTSFLIPEKMFVPMPELKSDRFGVPVMADGDIDSFLKGEDSLPAKLKLLKEMFAEQQKKADGEIGDYIKTQVAAMAEQKARWESLSKDCNNQINASYKAIEAEDKQRQMAAAGQDKVMKNYCEKFANLRNDPNPVCGDVLELVKVSEEAAAKNADNRITLQAKKTVTEFERACRSSNNEAKLEEDKDKACEAVYYPEDDKSPSPQKRKRCTLAENRLFKATGKTKKQRENIDIAKLCGNGMNNNLKEFMTNLANLLPDEDEKKLVKTEADKTEKVTTDTDTATKPNEFFNNIKESKKLGKTSKDIIADFDSLAKKDTTTTSTTFCGKIKNAAKAAEATEATAATTAETKAEKAANDATKAKTDEEEAAKRLELAEARETEAKLATTNKMDEIAKKLAEEELKKATIDTIKAKADLKAKEKLTKDAKETEDKAERKLTAAKTAAATAKTAADKKAEEVAKENKDHLTKILATLTDHVNPIIEEKEEIQVVAERIGERPNEPCDALNNSSYQNSSIFGPELRAFDQAVLGKDGLGK